MWIEFGNDLLNLNLVASFHTGFGSGTSWEVKAFSAGGKIISREWYKSEAEAEIRLNQLSEQLIKETKEYDYRNSCMD